MLENPFETALVRRRVSRGLKLAGLWLVLTAPCIAQSVPWPEIVRAVASPETLARYVEEHRSIDWKAIRRALGLDESQRWLAPCGGDFPAGESPCTAGIETVSRPDQEILTIRGSDFSYAVERLRYVRDAKGGWRFAGEHSALQRNSPSHHAIFSFGDKPFLKISSDHSQNGVAIQQRMEEWFDLTLPDFQPVFSVTVDGSQFRFGFGVGRTIHTSCKISKSNGVEEIEVSLGIRFDGATLDQSGAYLGLYQRSSNQKAFTLRRASISGRDFEELGDPFSSHSNEKLLIYAFPGLQKIATGSSVGEREWLRSILEHAKDTPEKRLLLKLLATPYSCAARTRMMY